MVHDGPVWPDSYLFFQNLAIYNNEKLPKTIKIAQVVELPDLKEKNRFNISYYLNESYT